MRRGDSCNIESYQNFKTLQEESFGNGLGVRKIRDSKFYPLLMLKPRRHLQISLNPILNIPKVDFSLKETSKDQEQQPQHHSSPITIRNIRKNYGQSNDRNQTKVYLKIPNELRGASQMIDIEKMVSMQRSKLHQLKKQRFSVSNLRQNSEVFRKTRWTHVKAVSQLEHIDFKENLLRINVSKFKSQKWKLFKRKKYVDTDIFSIKPSKINKNTHQIRQLPINSRQQSNKFQLYSQSQKFFKNLRKLQKQCDIFTQMETFSPWSNTMD